MSDSLTKADIAEATTSLMGELLKGESESFIAEVYGWDPETFKRIKKLMVQTEVEANRNRTREE